MVHSTASVPGLTPARYDAILFVSFGGPERTQDIMPFLERVTRGRAVPRERLVEVAKHYEHFGGKSPINDQNRAIITALKQELSDHGIKLPVYFGNRNWHPLLEDTIQTMANDGVSRMIVFITSAFSSYSGCRQYIEDIDRARKIVGARAPEAVKLRNFHGHPLFLEAMTDQLTTVLRTIDGPAPPVVFTAHSIPVAMALASDYQLQIEAAAATVARQAQVSEFSIAYQSKSGSPHSPWIGPDILEAIRDAADKSQKRLVLVPIGFISDHMEVIFDLDVEAVELADSLGVKLWRAPTVGTSPRFVQMIRDLIQLQLADRTAASNPAWAICRELCCQPNRQAALPVNPT